MNKSPLERYLLHRLQMSDEKKQENRQEIRTLDQYISVEKKIELQYLNEEFLELWCEIFKSDCMEENGNIVVNLVPAEQKLIKFFDALQIKEKQ